ncbi:hypothetical protein OE749_18295 [Aestuariibacter sp. AA17]|uniref:Uncharacterized protein n=1 Tax=Fluctibacter corallii TaxID=2984329 RepID=A0ABT3ADA4_9ALTE|nr:hypothetical protein [Aestuariibacter sp. AA17]MCV2886650.1 hypothetical protein [Aestuariibacter sp. AA17]
MIKGLILSGVCAFSMSITALASNLVGIHVEGNVALINVAQPDVNNLPECAQNSEYFNQYAIDITSTEGKAQYAMVISALSSNQSLHVVGNNRCELIPNVTGVSRLYFDDKIEQIRDFSHTILGQYVETYIGFTDEYENNSAQKTYFEAFGSNETPSPQFSQITTTERTLIGQRLEGKGWLTAVLLPAMKKETRFKLEVLLDGETYVIEDVTQRDSGNWHGRVFFGMVNDSLSGYDGRPANMIASPNYVAQEGKGVSFNQSLEVWLTLDKTPDTSTEGGVYAAFDMLFGSAF